MQCGGVRCRCIKEGRVGLLRCKTCRSEGLAKHISGKSVPSRRKSQSKSPKVGMYLLYSRDCGETVQGERGVTDTLSP